MHLIKTPADFHAIVRREVIEGRQTNKALAEKAGLHIKTVCALSAPVAINGGSIETLCKLADALGLKVVLIDQDSEIFALFEAEK